MTRPDRVRRAASFASLALAFASLLPAHASAEAIADGNDVTFRVDARTWAVKPTRVNVVGTFQGWNKDATPLKDDDHDGIWEAKVHVDGDGPQAYKFSIDGGSYVPDETGNHALETDDGFGGKNSNVLVGKSAVAATPAQAGTTFTLDVSNWKEKPKTIHVAGEFNGWDATALAMTHKGDVWTATVKLPEGVTHYKFVVDGSRWITDPKADPALDADDGNGGKNSGVKVTPSGAAAKPAAEASKGFAFNFDATGLSPQPTAVFLAGDFNGWSTTATPMTKTGDAWTVRLPLTEGNHAYKFVVDGKWTPDPKADKALETDDGNGGMNSGVVVGPSGATLPPPKPNAVNVDAILFDPTSPSDLNVISETSLRVRLRAQDNDVEHVYVQYATPTSSATNRIELHKLGATFGYATYGGTVDVPKPTTGTTLLQYHFELTDGTADVMWTGKPAGELSAELKPTFTTPAWATNAVWYQVFPERFKNGDPSNDPSNDEGTHLVNWTSKWWDVAPGEAAGTDGGLSYGGPNSVFDRRYGGDIQGLKQSLPYLKSLGITAIYLNPVFEAASMHKYDATDYRHIDNHFGVKGDWPVAGETEDPATWKFNGSDKVFLDFVAEAHAQGFKVVIDGVFNHVGRPNPFFQDVLANGKNSKYADWFEIVDWGDAKNWHKMDNPLSVHGKPGGIQWNAWDGKNGFLPNWKKDNVTGIVHGPLEYINGITRRWLAPNGDPSKGIDGWRLDAAEQVPHPFWEQWRDVVKSTKPDAYITGEIWNPAQAWINDGKQFDAVMNYQFAMPTVSFFADKLKPMAPSKYASKMADVVYMYPEQASRAMMNLFDSHDTDRVASMFVNADRAYDAGNRLQDASAKNYSSRKPDAAERKRQMQAAAMQMTFLGGPMIYYGDEAGMWSPDDPSDRQPMTWPGLKFADPQVGFDQSIFDGYQRLIAIRNTLPTLKAGDFWPVLADDKANTFAFARGGPGLAPVYVAFNRSDKPMAIELPVAGEAGASLVNWVDSAQAKLNVAGDRPGDRPTLTATGSGGIAAKNGVVHVTLPPFGTAILSAAPAH